VSGGGRTQATRTAACFKGLGLLGWAFVLYAELIGAYVRGNDPSQSQGATRLSSNHTLWGGHARGAVAWTSEIFEVVGGWVVLAILLTFLYSVIAISGIAYRAAGAVAGGYCTYNLSF
jgi:hypothetical protein